MKTKSIIIIIIVIIITILICKWWCCPMWVHCDPCPEGATGGRPESAKCCDSTDSDIPAGYVEYSGAAKDARLATYTPADFDSTQGTYIPSEVINYFYCKGCTDVYAMFVKHPDTDAPTVMFMCDGVGIIKTLASGETGPTCPTKCP